jgi:hypothetical protein
MMAQKVEKLLQNRIKLPKKCKKPGLHRTRKGKKKEKQVVEAVRGGQALI